MAKSRPSWKKTRSVTRSLDEALTDNKFSGNVTHMIRQWIQTGKLSDGQRLPTVRDLAERFNSTRYTVHESIKQLHKDGWAVKKGRHYLAANPLKVDYDHLTVATNSIVFLSEIAAITGRNALSPGYDLMIEYSAMLQARGRHINVVSLDPHSLGNVADEELVERLTREKPNGVITFHNTLFSEPSLAVLHGLKSKGIATVTYGNDPEFNEFDTIESDHESGAYALTKLLIKRGCKRILPFMPLQILASTTPLWLQLRLRGYIKAMQEASLKPLPELRCSMMPCDIPTKMVYHDAVRTAAGYLVEYINRPDPIDAIMAISDTFCFPLTTACRELFHLDTNKTILITGYDNYWKDTLLYEWEPVPPFATVDKRNIDIGGHLIDMLMARLTGKITSPVRHELIEPQLVITDDCGN